MNASEAREMHQASLRHPGLVTQVVPSPLTFQYDATIQDIVKKGTLGDLLYIEVTQPVSVAGNTTSQLIVQCEELDHKNCLLRRHCQIWTLPVALQLKITHGYCSSSQQLQVTHPKDLLPGESPFKQLC